MGRELGRFSLISRDDGVVSWERSVTDFETFTSGGSDAKTAVARRNGVGRRLKRVHYVQRHGAARRASAARVGVQRHAAAGPIGDAHG